MNKIFQMIKLVVLALVLSFGLSYVYAWTAPTSQPPNGNVSAPLNTSATIQTKIGALILKPSSGVSGVRIEANSVSGGWPGPSVWSTDTATNKMFAFGTRGSQFSISSETVPNNYQRLIIDHDTGNVAIGTGVTANKLEVAGNIKASGTICDGANNCVGGAGAVGPAGPAGPAGPQGPAGVATTYSNLPAGAMAGYCTAYPPNMPGRGVPALLREPAYSSGAAGAYRNCYCRTGFTSVMTGVTDTTAWTGGSTVSTQAWSCIKN